MQHLKYDAAIGRNEARALVQQLLDRAERGERFCAAMRLFMADGTWQDIAIGGTEEEQVQALADLRAAKDKAH